MPARRLIIGCGYLGSRVVRYHADRGDLVYTTTRSNSRFEELRSLGATPLLWDVTAPSEANLPDVDTVVYCVGMDRSAGHSMREVYVNGLANTLRHLGDAGRIVYISSTGVYGDSQGDWVDESVPPQPLDEAGAICLEAESVLAEECQRRGTQFVILRLAGIYGPGRMIGASSLAKGQSVAADPDVYLNLIEVSDAARVVLAVGDQQDITNDLFNVADGKPASRRDFYAEVAKLLGLPEPTFTPEQSRRGRGNRRIDSRKLFDQIEIELEYPDFRAGLTHCLTATRNPPG